MTGLEYVAYRGDRWTVNTVDVAAALQDGDVVEYTPERDWCREGIGIVYQRIRGEGGLSVYDTFWRAGDGPGQDDHSLTADELLTVEFLFRPSEYRELGQYEEWDDFSRDDRALISSQHGLRKRRFLRLGAQPDWQTRYDNASREVDEATRAIDSASRRLEHAAAELLVIASEREAAI